MNCGISPASAFRYRPFDVALDQHFHWALHIDFDEIRNPRAHFVAHLAIRGDGRGDGDHAVARQQLADEADAADVLIAVFLAEAQAFRKMGPHYVAIEHLHPGAELAQASAPASGRSCSCPRRSCR